MLLAERARSVNVLRLSAKAVIRADLLFTLPGVLLVLINGLVMVFRPLGETCVRLPGTPIELNCGIWKATAEAQYQRTECSSALITDA